MTLRGIDVSEHQGSIDWKAVKEKAQVDFAILRAGYGRALSQKDHTFEQNYVGCKSADIPCGVYWYSYATTPDEAKAEARVLLEVIKGKQFEYPIYFDVEEQRQFNLGKTAVSNIIRAFLETVEKEGYFVGLYMSASPLNSYVDDDIKDRYAIWVAQYASRCTYNRAYGMWQYGIAGSRQWDTTNKQSISGVKGECDLDYSYCDYPAVIKSAGLNGFPKTETTKKEPEETKKRTIEVELTQDGVTYTGTLTEK